ncbi:MAG: triose-phosphate isomerase [Bdellovibrionales bacterium]
MSTNKNKLLVAGNWKMNNSLEEAVSLSKDITGYIHENPEILQKADFLICPSHVHLAWVNTVIADTPVMLGGQDCSQDSNGAHTGDVSAEMLSDLGCGMVILGHSERRQDHKEQDALIVEKVIKAHEQGIKTVICVGETLEQRESGKAFDVVLAQLEGSIPVGAKAEDVVVAYEPVWAIGTGKVASPEDVEAIHNVIADYLKEKLDNGDAIRILYGGSVKPDNAGDLSRIDHVHGFLVGGASLKAGSFVGIAQAIEE